MEIKLLPPQAMIALYLAAALAAGGAACWVYDTIWDRGYAAREAEAVETQKANDKAIADAQQVLNDRIAQLTTENERLINDVERLDKQADEDPAGDTGGFQPDSVRRLNAVR